MLDSIFPPLRIGTVAVAVHDLDRVRRFYEQVIGLREIEAGADTARLGTADQVLIELRREPRARFRSPREAGLFHTAFLLPTRADLGRWIVHAARSRFPLQGASDHAVSEAVYLADPEGNGIEIYSDRPRDTWRWSKGEVVLTTDHLDTDDLIRDGGSEPWRGVPAGTTIGHVHLQVGAIAPAEAFYAGVLGVPLTARYPGGSFYGSNGYHHHLATNVWNSRNAAPRTEPTTGLANIDLVSADAAMLNDVAHRAAAGGFAVRRQASALNLRDPWGTSLTLNAPGT